MSHDEEPLATAGVKSSKGRMSFLSPNQQCQSTEGIHSIRNRNTALWRTETHCVARGRIGLHMFHASNSRITAQSMQLLITSTDQRLPTQSPVTATVWGPVAKTLPRDIWAH